MYIFIQMKKFQKLSQKVFLKKEEIQVHWDAGINSLPIQVACEKNIKLVFLC